jgi:NADPH:quinone reductase-like Zn-dependent oxidoreductase
MKAIVCTQYGDLENVLQLKDVDKPVPKDGEILVKIHAASVNPADLSMRGGIARLFNGLRKPKSARVGIDFSGRVEAVGNNAAQFRPGDEVFGACSGSFAEYATVSESRSMLKPANVSFEEAAAVPVAATTALQGLRDKGKIHSGQKVLVNGASGGVGTFAVQIAKSYGTEVTGVCSTRNLDMVRSIGADHVIDYTKQDFTKNGQLYDLIYDAVGNRLVSDYKRALRDQGICAIAGFTNFRHLLGHMLLGQLVSTTGNKKVGFMGIAKINHKDLVSLSELLEARKVVSVIDRRYPLSETATALLYLGERHTRGKVIITVNQNNQHG